MQRQSNFKQQESSRPNSNITNQKLNNEEVFTNNWDRYARKTAQPAQQSSKLSQSKSQQSENLKGSIKRYYRSDIAPKAQYKQYLSDSNNVFYEDRDQLHRLRFFSRIELISGVIFAFLFLIFVGLYFVTPFEGECPDNAECGAFVHCYHGFEYDSTLNRCVLSTDLYDEIENVCIQRINKAREEWGDQECEGKPDELPQIQIKEIVEGISNSQLKDQLLVRLENFLKSQENQEKYYFEFYSGRIFPTVKKYSLSCKLDLLVRSTYFKLGFPVLLLLFIIAFISLRKMREEIIANKIYQELRKRTISEKLLNISYAKIDLEKEYGDIGEKMWEKVDGLRTKDRDIGFLQDDFLYWKML